MRLSEVMGLQVKHINFDNRSIRIEQSWDTRLLKVNRFTKNKTVREIAICDRVTSELKGFITEQGKDQDSFIFCREGTNKPYDDKFLPRHMEIAIQKAGIKVNHRYITFHSFRHGVNTYLLEAGINPFKVAAFLGHSNKYNMTALYNKTGLKDQDDIRRYFQKLLTGQDNLVVLSKEA
jgi:integrase